MTFGSLAGNRTLATAVRVLFLEVFANSNYMKNCCERTFRDDEHYKHYEIYLWKKILVMDMRQHIKVDVWSSGYMNRSTIEICWCGAICAVQSVLENAQGTYSFFARDTVSQKQPRDNKMACKWGLWYDMSSKNRHHRCVKQILYYYMWTAPSGKHYIYDKAASRHSSLNRKPSKDRWTLEK